MNNKERERERERERKGGGKEEERLVQGHDSGLAEMEEAAMEYFKANALAFQEQGMATLDVLEQRPDILPLTLKMTKSLVQAAVVQANMASFAAGVAQEKAIAALAHG
mmetsp:Transcript_50223/g.81083  ORF Transcript_50223/g.81083 Transcript_50223/m.81083 type:complete len:108 (+) Transcript_50223:2-325(+)